MAGTHTGGNVPNVSSQVKRSSGIDGYIYQLELLMLYLHRGVSLEYSFNLGTETTEAEKFDDLFFEYIQNGETKYRILQAKHKSSESAEIVIENLIEETDSNFSLIKYFFSFRDAKSNALFKNGIIENVIICTNAGLHQPLVLREGNTETNITVKEIIDEDKILVVKHKLKPPVRYRFQDDIIPLLKPRLEKYNLTRLARRLTECLLNDNPIQHHQKNDIFKKYHGPLAHEVIDVKTGKFYNNFVSNVGISKDATAFRKAFAKLIIEKTKGKGSLETINDAIDKKIEINEGKVVRLVLSKKFGKTADINWPDDTISKDEIKDFLNHLIFAVNQPNEDELGEIIRNEINKEFNLDFITTDTLYNKFFMKILRWYQGKDTNVFLSYKIGKEFFEEALKGIPIWFNIRDPIPSFTGRTEELKKLHEALQKKGQMVLSHATSVSGLGGIGKSELARKYISEYSDFYENRIVWINAESYDSLSESFRRLAQDTLGISAKNIDGNDKHIKSIIEFVYKFFVKRKSLFIFDNAEKYRTQNEGDEGIDKFLPCLPSDVDKPYLLITSRNWKWGNMEVLKLNIFTEKEAAEFIMNALKMQKESQGNEVNMLAKKLEYFPLALQQAVAYIKQQDEALQNVGLKFDINSYLRIYDKETKKLLDFNFPEDSCDSYTKTTFTTWKITIHKIKENQVYGQKAAHVLEIMAYFVPESIPVHIFLESEVINRDAEELGNVIQLLKQYSMINTGNEQCSINIHRLVQQVTRIVLKDEDKEKEILRKALMLFKNNVNSTNVDHTMSVFGFIKNYEDLVRDFNKLPHDIMETLMGVFRYEEAYLFGKQADQLLTNQFGLNHVDTLGLKNMIGQVLLLNGKGIEAFQTFEQIYDLCSLNNEKNYIIFSLKAKCGKGAALRLQGKYDDTLTYYNEAYEGFMKVLGPNCRDTLKAKNDVAVALKSQGKYHKAYKIYKELDEAHEKEDDFPRNEHLKVKNNMAIVLKNLGQYNQALSIYQIILKYRQDILGPNDLQTLTTKNDMAIVLNRLCRYDEAFTLHTEVSEKRKEILGEDHPQTLGAKDGLATVLFNQKKFIESMQLRQEILDKRLKRLGPNHTDTLNSKIGMGEVLIQQEKYIEAFELFNEILNIQNQTLGPHHPFTLNTKHNIATVLGKQGKYSDALEKYQQVFDVRKRPEILGPYHPDTLTTKYEIGITNIGLFNLDEALRIFQDILDILRRTENSETYSRLFQDSKFQIATILDMQGKLKEVKKTNMP